MNSYNHLKLTRPKLTRKPGLIGYRWPQVSASLDGKSKLKIIEKNERENFLKNRYDNAQDVYIKRNGRCGEP